MVRRLSTLREMDALDFPITDITLSALTQSLARANNVGLARSQLAELLARGIQTSPSTWRPLLHATAVSGDIETTERVYGEMKEHTGKEVFDSFKSRISHAYNYVVLAYGHGEGYEMAVEKFEEAKRKGFVDLLTYTFMIELALNLHTHHGFHRNKKVGERGLAKAYALWDEMKESGFRPSASLCHTMFSVFASGSKLAEAEELFAEMKAASNGLRTTGETLASLWTGGDLPAVRSLLASVNADDQRMCHTTTSYVRIIEACILAGEGEKAKNYLEELKAEADSRGIALGHGSTTPLLMAFQRGSKADLGVALELHKGAYDAGRPCAPSPSLTFCNVLMKNNLLEDAALVLLQMSFPARHQGSLYSTITQRLISLATAADAMQPGTKHDALNERLEQLHLHFKDVLGDDSRPQPRRSGSRGGDASGATSESSASDAHRAASAASVPGSEHAVEEGGTSTP